MTEARLDQARARRLDEAVANAHILLTAGAGGVGKTTVAAALGLAGARQGRRTLVLTIDPARRLAQAMGIDVLDNAPRPVEVDGVEGALSAMMLNMERTFDELVDRHAQSRDQARAIKDNRIYQTLSSTLAGTQEYMAMEKLYDLDESGKWDLIVVDTPPTRSALDFLDAPNRMTDFLEGRLLKVLLRPGIAAGKGVTRVIGFGTQAFMRVAGRVTGMDLLEDLADFFRNFEGMYEGFKQRAEKVRRRLQEPGSRFVVVASPQPPPLREAHFFLERLEQEGLHTAGVVVNRVHPTCPTCPPTDELRRAATSLGDGTRERAAAETLTLLADIVALANRERRDIEAALFGVMPHALVEVPQLAGDVHDLETLGEIAGILTG